MLRIGWRDGWREIEFTEFMQLARAGVIPPEALVSGEALTNGRSVPAGELRTYALARGWPLPPPRSLPPRDPRQSEIAPRLARFGWHGGMLLAGRSACEGDDGGSGASPVGGWLLCFLGAASLSYLAARLLAHFGLG